MFGQVKQFVVSNPISEMIPPKPQPNTYTINSKRGKWWQKKLYELAWKVLNKYGKVEEVFSPPEYGLSYNRIVIDYEHLEELIYQHEKYLRAFYNQEVDYIIVGRDVLSAMNRRELDNFVPINTEFPSDYVSRTRYHGKMVTFNYTPIKVVPYFEGFLAVMKDKEY